MDYRIEHDTMGEVKVPADKYWGAQTERSFENFKIGSTKMPLEIIHAFGVLKKAAALANWSLGMIDAQRAELIAGVCDELISGKLDEHFPLVVYQTGSGTQSNMNVNEVVANRGNEITGEKLLHPNDHVNKSQSSNDTFPTAMHIAAVVSVEDKLLPALTELRDTLQNLEVTYTDLVKTGRTHLQDATPLTLGQEISGWRSMLNHCLVMIGGALSGLRELALGGTAVGTGLNAHHDFGRASAAEISKITGKEFVTAE
ncbi:MAG: lyase family protein, partial [Emergencia timonensis]